MEEKVKMDRAEQKKQYIRLAKDNNSVLILVLILAAVLLARLGFAAEDRERAAKRRKYGKINRAHARNPEYPENQERGA